MQVLQVDLLTYLVIRFVEEEFSQRLKMLQNIVLQEKFFGPVGVV